MTVTTEPSTPTAAVWHLLTDRWRGTLRAKALSPNTERGYLYTARKWAEWLASEGLELEPDEIEDFHIEDFVAGIITATSEANAAFHYRNLRVFFAWLVKRKHITAGNPMDTTEPPRVPTKLVPILTDDDHEQLLAACEGRDFCAVRDRALILFFKDTGARVSEVGNLDVDAIMLGLRQARVMGKGRKERLVGYGSDAGLALARYLKARAKLMAERGVTSSHLWLNHWGQPLTVQGIKWVLRRRGQQAGVAKVHAHRFRHSFAHDWKANQGSNEGLMGIGGWSSSKMAEHYGKIARANRALAEQQRLMLGMAAGDE